jgi:glycosyltransferase involved in cell wall biosynthesis
MSQFEDERIKYIRYENNGGNAVARNVGVKEAKGDYIAFVDSDDEYHPTYLEKAVKLLSSNDKASFLWAGTRTVAIDKSYSESIWIPKRENHPNQFLYELHVGIGRGFLIEKKCFNNIKFDKNLRTAVDTDFLIRLRQNYDFTVLKEVLLNIHTQPGSVRSFHGEKKKSYNIIINKHKEIIENDAYLRSKFYYKLFWLSLYDGDKKLARYAYKKLPFKNFKPSFLWLIFKFQSRHKAIEIHRKLST